MRLAYADPPYLGCCKLYDHYHPDGLCWDDLDTHRQLIERLERDYDGWALSGLAKSLGDILPMLTVSYRIAAWVKPFAAYKRNVRIAYTWEPVIVHPARSSSTTGAPVSRDHLSAPITMRRGFVGAKPDRFNRWVLDLIGYVDGEDTVDDLYPGTGGMGAVLAAPTLPLSWGNMNPDSVDDVLFHDSDL